MSFSSSSMKSIQHNRSQQVFNRGRIYKFKFDISGVRSGLQYNEDFEKKYSKEQLAKMKGKVQTELRRERMRGLFFTLIVTPIVLGILWYLITNYFHQLSLG